MVISLPNKIQIRPSKRRHVVENLLADLDLAMGLAGFRSVSELDASILRESGSGRSS